MTVSDLFHIYAMKHGVSTVDAMLKDYPLDGRLDRQALNGRILVVLGDRRPYYNDTSVMKFTIDNWFDTHYKNIKRMCDAVYAEYDLLIPEEHWRELDTNDTRDLLDKHDDKESRTYDQSKHDEGNIKNGGEDITTIIGTDQEKGSESTDQNISAYNSGGMQPQAQEIQTFGKGTDSNHTTTNKMGSTQNNTKDEQVAEAEDVIGKGTLHDIDEKKKGQEKEHDWGRSIEKISDIINGEIALAKFNIYDWICAQLDNEICIGLY